MVTTVKHVDIFLAIYRDFKRIGERFVRGKKADLFAIALRVLELMRNEQIKALLASGLLEEEITEDMLWFPVLWRHFKEHALGHYSERSFETIMEKVVEAGFARRRYVKCLDRKHRSRQEELVLLHDEQGHVLTYDSIEEAKADEHHSGDIINQFFFCAEAVNRLIAQIYHLAQTPQPPTPPGEKGDAQRRSAENLPAEQPPVESSDARGGNLRTSETSADTIRYGLHFCEGSSPENTQISQRGAASSPSSQNPADNRARQNCEGEPGKSAGDPSQKCEQKARKSASNEKNSKKNLEESGEEVISAEGALRLILSQFDFSQSPSQEAILRLSRLFYPPLPARYRTEAEKEAAYARVQGAAHNLATMPLVHELGLRRLAALMAYQTDEHSPCQWRAYCRRKNANFVPRLWHLESETVLWKMSQELFAVGWWPDVLPQAGLVETPPDIDLADLAGIELSQRRGMDGETASMVEAWLSGLLTPHGYFVSRCSLGYRSERGYAVEVWYEHEDGSQRALRFYHADQWDLIVQADEFAPLGSLAFVERLSALVHEQDQAPAAHAQ